MRTRFIAFALVVFCTTAGQLQTKSGTVSVRYDRGVANLVRSALMNGSQLSGLAVKAAVLLKDVVPGHE